MRKWTIQESRRLIFSKSRTMVGEEKIRFVSEHNRMSGGKTHAAKSWIQAFAC